MQAVLDMIARHKSGEHVGMTSVCSAHPLVIAAACRHAASTGTAFVLIEATSNQVNQDGGYTGMTPSAFRRFVEAIGAEEGLDPKRILLGGDHLGPNAWQHLPADEAMAKADMLIDHYVAAGFRKIHLDCSMACADDDSPLSDERVATRAARLCAVAEGAYAKTGGEPPVYVVGTEVPVPGGAAKDLETLAVTTPEDARMTIDVHERVFRAHGLNDAWNRIIAIVVQPGVEFDHHKIVDYNPARAVTLSTMIEAHPHIVYEAHSTDYQTPAALKSLVRDHFAILKVGPGITFALREALFALDQIESELLGSEHAAGLRRTVLAAMAAEPKYWQRYYSSSGAQLHLDCQYSLSDRIRYYWPQAAVQAALERLVANLEATPPPLALLSQYLPAGYQAVREGRIRPGVRELAMHHIELVLQQYASACGYRSGGGDDALAA